MTNFFRSCLLIFTFFISNSQAENSHSKNGNTSIGNQNNNLCGEQDHLVLEHESLAKEMLVFVEEQKDMIQRYEKTSYYFGRQGEETRSKDFALLRKYERAAVVNMSKANSRRVTLLEYEKCGLPSTEKRGALHPFQFKVAGN